MKLRYLIASDFDGTLFDTFSSSPNGINVQKAYYLAIHDIFGSAGAYRFGVIRLHNRTPSEITLALLYGENGQREEVHTPFVASAKAFYEDGSYGDHDLQWNQMFPEQAITELLVKRKLKYLLSEIGQQDKDRNVWPQPCGEAVTFINTVVGLQEEGKPVDFAVISSGHEDFIRKTFDTWGLPHPNILVTEDDIRPLKYPQDIKRRFKPGQFPLALAHYKWLNQHRFASDKLHTDGSNLSHLAFETKQRMVYIGDSFSKDVLMAVRGNIEAIHYPSTPWEKLTRQLIAGKDLFDGRPIREIIKPKSNTIEGESSSVMMRERR